MKTCSVESLSPFLSPQIKQCFVHDCIASTQDFLMEKTPPPDGSFYLCLAKSQHKGRGRRGQPWLASPNQSLLMSISTCLTLPHPMPPLALMLTTACIEHLHQMGVSTSLQLKWPNDLYIGHKKLGGLLIESVFDACRTHVVVGLGINLTDAPLKDSTSLLDAWPNPCAIEKLIAGLSHTILSTLSSLCMRTPWSARWNAIHGLQNQQIILQEDPPTTTHVISIDESGELILKNGRRLRADQTRIIWPIKPEDDQHCAK